MDKAASYNGAIELLDDLKGYRISKGIPDGAEMHVLDSFLFYSGRRCLSFFIGGGGVQKLHIFAMILDGAKIQDRGTPNTNMKKCTEIACERIQMRPERLRVWPTSGAMVANVDAGAQGEGNEH